MELSDRDIEIILICLKEAHQSAHNVVLNPKLEIPEGSEEISGAVVWALVDYRSELNDLIRKIQQYAREKGITLSQRARGRT